MIWRRWLMNGLVLGVLVIASGLGQLASAQDFSALRYVPVQDGGRIKPYDTFAREALKLFYGREKYKSASGEKIPAYEVITTIIIAPDVWSEAPLFQVRHSGLREALKLSNRENVFHSSKELFSNDRLPLLIQELRSKRQSKDKLDPYFQAIQTLESQLGLFEGLRSGSALRLAPRPPVAAAESGAVSSVEEMRRSIWLSLAELEEPLRGKFQTIALAFAKGISSRMGKKSGSTSTAAFSASVKEFTDAARAINPSAYGDERRISLEIFYNDFHPYQWSWITYILAAIALAVSTFYANRYGIRGGVALVLIGFLLSAFGLGLRSYLTGRPPVSNMYETIVWVPWAAVLFSLVLAKVYRNYAVLIASTLVSVFCLILSDLSPTVLDKSLQPLEPVLRDNFWLLTHVLIIVASYGAFFLAFALGLWVLSLYLVNEKKNAAKIKDGSLFIYRAIQIGLVMLTAGTILGGIWADYSWGRFWGWDPKETWAFIAIMGYLALLHARITGLVRDFGTAVWAVVAFTLVIMAWYGVNFVLGAGLHTYGFGAGGVEYVAGFVAVFLLFTLYVVTVRQKRLSKPKPR